MNEKKKNLLIRRAGNKKQKKNLKANYKVHLTRKEDVRRLLSTVINQYRRKEISREEAKTIAYLCNSILAVMVSMKQDDLERRIGNLENSTENLGGPNEY